MALMKAVVCALALAPVIGLHGAASQSGWDIFTEPQLGTRIEIPTAIFTRSAGPAKKGTGQQFETEDGRAGLIVYSIPNADRRETPARFMSENYKAPAGAVDYKRVTGTFFAISAIHDDEIYYSRCNFSPTAGGAIHCFDLKYPKRDKRAWDGIVTRMSLSLRPLVRS
jgi:hypothetical protein